MTKKRSTKRALLMSALSLMMCMSMLIGSTFAWFTDSVTSAGNKIQSGTLDIQLLMHNGTDYADISDSTNPIFGAGSIAKNNNAETLWEPGKTQVAYLAIKNNGNLDLNYTVNLDVENVGKNLYEVMEYAIIPDARNASVTSWTGGNSVVVGTQSVSEDVALKVGETHYFALAIHMDEAAGNEYMGGEVDFDLTVLATQLASESDSFNNQYDAFSDYDGEISNVASLVAALENGGTYKVINDITLGSTVTVPAGVTVNLDLGGKTISAANTGAPAIENNGELTITGGELTNTISETKGSHTIKNNAGATLIIEDGKIGNAKNAGAAVYNNGGYVEINGGTFASKQEDVKSDGKCAYAFINYSGTMIINDATVTEPTHGLFAAYGGNLTVNGGDYTLKDEDGTNGLACYMTYTTGEGRIILNDGNFNIVNTRSNRYMFHYDGTANKNYFASAVAEGGYVTMNGGTYNFDVTDYAAEGYVVTQNSDGTYTVEKNVVPEGATLVSDGLYKDNTDNVYYITNATGLKTMQAEVSATTSGSVNDGEWVLFKDIDMSGVAWTPISNFHGDFNGNGKTISNLTVNADGAAGLFGTNTNNGDGYIVPTIKNLNVTKANVTGTVKVGVVVGGISAIKIDSVNVTDSTATGTEFVGGIQGWSYGPAGATITNCTVTGCTIQNTSASTEGKVGGIGGYIALGTVENCTVSGSTISGYRCVGALLGRGGNAGDGLTMTISNYNVSGNTVTSTSDTAGEVVGDALKVEYK